MLFLNGFDRLIQAGSFLNHSKRFFTLKNPKIFKDLWFFKVNRLKKLNDSVVLPVKEFL